MIPNLLALLFRWECLVTFFLIVLVYKCVSWLFNPLRRIPGPKGGIIFGNTLQMAHPNDAHQVLLEWERKYGEIFKTWTIIGGFCVHLSNPEHIKQVLMSESRNYHKSKFLSLFLGEIGVKQSLMQMNGHDHAVRRKMLNPAFSISKVKNYVSIFNYNSNQLIQFWKKRISETKSSSFNENVQDRFLNLTLDVIGQSAFGYEFDSINNPHCKEFMAADMITRGMFNIRARILELLFPILKIFPSKSRQEINEASQKLRSLLQKVISTRREENSLPNAPERKDLLQMIMSLKDENGNSLEEEQIFEEAMVFMIAGHETTSISMTWAILMLSKYPQFQDEARNEINKFLDKNEDITFEQIGKMKFLDQFIKETMRLFPTALHVDRTTVKDTKIGPYNIPKGTNLLVRVNAAQRDAKYWKDANTFNPYRFAEQDPGKNASSNLYKFLPFGRGPRMCLGYKFAEVEMKCVLAKLIQNFQFKLTESQSGEFKGVNRLTYQPDSSIHVTISEAV